MSVHAGTRLGIAVSHDPACQAGTRGKVFLAEADWTLGTKRGAMDELASRVTVWHSSAEAVAASYPT